MKLEQIMRQAMIDRGLPVGARPWCALGIRNRDHRHFPKPPIKPDELEGIETAVQGHHVRNGKMPADKVVEATGMKMNQVKLIGRSITWSMSRTSRDK